MPYFHIKIPYFLQKEINEVYIMHSLRSFAISTVAIFVPIFLLKNGYSFFELALYFGAYSVFNIIFSFIALLYSSKKGVRHAITLSMPIIILFFLALYKIDKVQFFLGELPALLLFSLLFTLGNCMYFMGFHIEFAKFSKKEKAAKQFGIVRAMSTMASVLGPFLGGVIVEFFSFNVLFSVVVVFLFLGVLPLFFSKELHQPFTFSIKEILKKTKTGIPFYAEGVRFMAAKYFWPVLLFMLGTSLSSIGGIFTISSLLLALFTIYIGKKTTEENKHNLLKIGALLNSLSLIVRSVLKTFSLIAVAQGFGGLSWALVQLPFMSMFYNNSKKKGIAETIFMREVYLNLGRLTIVMLLALLLIFLKPETAFITIIILAAITMLFMTKVKDEN
ncbi:MAG: MFS transporter [Nanoarchaeota archaeon]